MRIVLAAKDQLKEKMLSFLEHQGGFGHQGEIRLQKIRVIKPYDYPLLNSRPL